MFPAARVSDEVGEWLAVEVTGQDILERREQLTDTMHMLDELAFSLRRALALPACDSRPMSGVRADFFTDENGNPNGGVMDAVGFHAVLQRGPRGQGGDRQAPNGSDVETFLEAADMLLSFYQDRFPSGFNERALLHVRAGQDELSRRMAERMARGVEGTNEG